MRSGSDCRMEASASTPLMHPSPALKEEEGCEKKDERARRTMRMLSVDASTIFHFCCVGLVVSVLLPYVIAVRLGHVAVFLPMISDCQVREPEAYFSRALFVLFGGCGTALMSSIQMSHIRSRMRSTSTLPPHRGTSKSALGDRLNNISLVLAFVCSASTVGVSVVSKASNRYVHDRFALLAFVGWNVHMYMLFIIYRKFAGVMPESQRGTPSRGTAMLKRWHRLLRLVFCIGTSACIGLFITFLHLGYYHRDTKYRIAICEWLAFACIVAFHWLAVPELDLDDDFVVTANIGLRDRN